MARGAILVRTLSLSVMLSVVTSCLQSQSTIVQNERIEVGGLPESGESIEGNEVGAHSRNKSEGPGSSLNISGQGHALSSNRGDSIPKAPSNELCSEIAFSFTSTVYNGCTRSIGYFNPCLKEAQWPAERELHFPRNCQEVIEELEDLRVYRKQYSFCQDRSKKLASFVDDLSQVLKCIAEHPEKCAIVEEESGKPLSRFPDTIAQARMRFKSFENEARKEVEACKDGSSAGRNGTPAGSSSTSSQH